MGLDTRQPRASRDGGVDCIADDPRPIMAGKVVIQAKRYRQDRSFRTCLACTVRDADPHRGHTASGVVVRARGRNTVTASTTSSMTSDDYPGRGGIKITIVRE
jgi:hypothetical protein